MSDWPDYLRKLNAPWHLREALHKAAEAMEAREVYAGAHLELLRECSELLEHDYGNGIDNGYWPDIAPLIHKLRDALNGAPVLPPITVTVAADAIFTARRESPAGWRGVLQRAREGISSGSRSVSDMENEQAIAFPLLDHIEEELEALAPEAPKEGT